MVKQQGHRAGPCKQKNKPHKARQGFRTKGEIDRLTKGRVIKLKTCGKKRKTESRQQRMNKAEQLRKVKTEAALSKKKSVGFSGSPSHLISFVPLNEGVHAEDCIQLLSGISDNDVKKYGTSRGIVHLHVARLKQKVSLLGVAYGDMISTLHASMAADTIVFLLSPYADGPDEIGATILRTLLADGCPNVLFLVQGMVHIPASKQRQIKAGFQKLADNLVPDSKLVILDSEQQAFLFLHNVLSKKPKKPQYFDNRSYIVAENVDAFPSKNQSGKFSLRVTGYVRGNRPISANSLLYVPGFGPHQIESIKSAEGPDEMFKKLNLKSHQVKTLMEDSQIGSVLYQPDPTVQESLEVLAAQQNDEMMSDSIDFIGNKDTMDLDIDQLTKPKTVSKIVPKGTSDYQAVWISETDNENESEGLKTEDEEDYSGSDQDMMSESQDDKVSIVTTGTTGGALGPTDPELYDAKFGMEANDDQVLANLRAEEDLKYPDEMDTPVDVSARQRFHKYRGLQSFRSSPWDADDNLPIEYSRIFQFENFNRTKRRILSEMVEQGALVGWYVTFIIDSVSEECAMHCTRSSSQLPGHYEPLVVHAMLPYEQKMSVVNMLIRRTKNNNDDDQEERGETIVKNKQKLIFKVGYRWFTASPVFSEHATADKFKVERFLRDQPTVATVYAPIMFPPSAVLVFMEDSGSPFGMRLLATGSILSINPRRLNIKRVVLSGHSFKIVKRHAVIRFMFFNREDIQWFMPIELRTKMGRRGHITEPLGTHGHMKCIFDSPLNQQDVVLMNLYKRVYPSLDFAEFNPASQ